MIFLKALVFYLEHQKNKLNDTWRIHNINKITAKENHPFTKFGSGNESICGNRQLSLIKKIK